MSAYCLFENLEVIDAAKLEEYKRLVPPIVARYGGTYVARGGAVELLEGAWTPTFPVMIEFPTIEAARAWYTSAEYAPLKAMRLASLRSNAVLVEGL